MLCKLRCPIINIRAHSSQYDIINKCEINPYVTKCCFINDINSCCKDLIKKSL